MSFFGTTLFDPSNTSAFGTLEASDLTPIIQGDWVYGINSQLWNYNYYFTVTTPGTPPVYGDQYTNNGNTYVIIYSVGTVLIASGTGAPTASGNLARATGSGTATIAYSAYTLQAGVTIGTGATVDTDTSGSGTSRLRIQSGTSATSYAFLTSRKTIRYRAGQGMTARFTPLFTAGAASSTQLWGVGTIGSNLAPYDGYFFGFNGTTMSIAHYTRGTPAWTAQTAWNGDNAIAASGGSFTWDPTKGTPAMIKYPYLGYGNIEFFLQNPTTGRWVLAHVIRYANTVATTQMANPTLQYLGYASNSGNTANLTLYSGSVGVFVSGVRSFAGSPRRAADSAKTAIATETCMLNLKNANTYNGVANRGMLRLNSVSFGTSSDTNGTLRFKIGATIGGTASYTPVSGTTADNGTTITAGNSIASVDTAGTTVAGGTYIFNVAIGQTTAGSLDLTPFEIYVSPSEVLTVSLFASTNTNASVSLNWSEDI